MREQGQDRTNDRNVGLYRNVDVALDGCARVAIEVGDLRRQCGGVLGQAGGKEKEDAVLTYIPHRGVPRKRRRSCP